MIKLSRAAQAAKTRNEFISTAKLLWCDRSQYYMYGIREISKKAGYTTGAFYAHFSSKAALYIAAFGITPPGDCPIERAAPTLFRILQNLLDGQAERIYDLPEPTKTDWLEAQIEVVRIKDEILDQLPTAPAKARAA